MSRAPEVLPVRHSSVHLSFPGRLAVWIAASLAVAASSGCMSVSDDEGRKPAPHSSTGRHGAVAEPDGGSGAPGGRQVRGTHGGPGAKGGEGAKTSASPNGSVAPTAQPPRGGQGPQPPRDPKPTGGGPVPSEQPPPQPTPSEPPPESPTPQPTEPTDPPPPSSAPEVRAGAMRLVDERGMCAEPAASPQVGPM